MTKPDGWTLSTSGKRFRGRGRSPGGRACFIRLAGCNIRCKLCDTNYTANRKLMTVDEIFNDARGKQLPPYLVSGGLYVITGGEPFRQNIGPLCDTIHASNGIVQIETNGTIAAPGPFNYTRHKIVCSPKTAFVQPVIAEAAVAWKYVVADGKVDPQDGLPLEVLGMPLRAARPTIPVRHWPYERMIYIQPLDEQDEIKNKRHLDQAVRVCQEFGYNLCLQMHKYAGLA